MEHKVSFVGDAAILSLPSGSKEHKKEIADSILSKRKNVRIVLNKISKVEGDRRVPRYEVLAGVDTVVTYREFGFTYRFDIARAFFNGRLSHERRRIAEQVSPGEAVMIPFAGVGPFAIPAAARCCRAVAVEMNGEACVWLGENARLNGVERNIDILNADAFSVPSILNKEFDRAIVPAPYGLDHILERLAPMVRRGGAVHFYTFKKKHQIAGLIGQYEDTGLKVEHYRRCGNVAPGVHRWAFDLRKK
jgi:tRNA (guanine37-N1)-methyltransferase